MALVLRNPFGRGVEARFRKFRNDVRGAKATSIITNAVKRGDSLTKVVRELRARGVSASIPTLNRYLAYTKSFDVLSNYDAIRRIRGGARSGINLRHYAGLYQPQDILFKVTLRLSDGSLRVFNRYITNFQGQSLTDVYNELELTYGETNQDADTKGEIINIQLA